MSAGSAAKALQRLSVSSYHPLARSSDTLSVPSSGDVLPDRPAGCFLHGYTLSNGLSLERLLLRLR